MSSPKRLYHELLKMLKPLGKWGRPELLETLALLMTGIFGSEDVRLNRIAARVPLAIKEESVAQRFRRWLKNPRVDVRVIYDPVARQMLASLRHTRVRIQIDRSVFDDRFNTLICSLSFRKRALPLLWMVLPHEGNATFLEKETILAHLAALLPPGLPQVIVLGDREFGAPDTMRSIQCQGWDFCLRVKGDQWAFLPDTRQWVQLRDLAPAPGQRVFLTGVTLTQSNCYGPVNFALACDPDRDDPWLIATNLSPSPRILRHYARRFGCEELFSDVKGRGFNMEASQLQHGDRFSRLFLAVALLVVWTVTVARRLRVTGAARTVSYRACETERYSLFQLGFRWLTHQLTHDYSLTPDPGFRLWSLA